MRRLERELDRMRGEVERLRTAQRQAGLTRAHDTANRIRGGEPVSAVLAGGSGGKGAALGASAGASGGSFDRRVARASAESASRRREVEKLAGEAEASEARVARLEAEIRRVREGEEHEHERGAEGAGRDGRRDAGTAGSDGPESGPPLPMPRAEGLPVDTRGGRGGDMDAGKGGAQQEGQDGAASQSGSRAGDDTQGPARDDAEGDRRSRPASAPSRRRSSFSGFDDGPRMTIARRRMLQEQQERERELDAMLNHTFKAKPIPESTRLPLFGRIMERQRTRREMVHEARAAEVAGQLRPFAALEQHEREMQRRKLRERAELIEQETRALRDGRRFKANPVPPTTREADAEAKAREERESRRAERVKARAQELAARSALPSRMQQWEARRQEEERMGRRAREREQRRRLGIEEPTFRPQVNPSVPDYEAMQHKFQRKLQQRKQSAGTTVPQPFGFDEPERVAAEEARKRAKREADRLRFERESEERAARVLGGSGALGNTGRSRGGKGGTRPMSATLGSTRMGSTWGGAGGVQGAPDAAMTRATLLREEATRRRALERQRKEREEAEQEEARHEEAARLRGQYAPMFAAMERERLGGRTLAWQMDEDTPEAQEARKQARRRQAENTRQLREKVRRAEARRTPLVLLQARAAAQAASRRQGLLNVAATVAAGHEDAALRGTARGKGARSKAEARASLAGRAAWRDMADAGGLGVEAEAGPGGAQRGVFSADDAAVMATAGRGEAEDALQRARGRMQEQRGEGEDGGAGGQ